MKLIVETYQADAQACTACPQFAKLSKRERSAQEQAQTAAAEKEKARERAAIAKGRPWRVRLVDAKTGKVVYECHKAVRDRAHADRIGQRFKLRYQRTGQFAQSIADYQVAQRTLRVTA